MKNQHWTMSNKNRTFSSLKNSKFTTGLILIAFLFGAFLGHSQTLSQFASAAGKSQMAVVPYPDLLKNIIAAEDVKKKAVSANQSTGKFSDAEFSKTKTLESIETAKTNLAEAKKKLAADKGTSSSETSKLKSDVSAKEEILEGHQDKLEALNVKIKTAIENWDAVHKARLNVEQNYREVEAALKVSLSNPTPHIGAKPSSSDKEAYSKYESDLTQLKAHIATINTKMKEQFTAHGNEIETANRMVVQYEKLLAVH